VYEEQPEQGTLPAGPDGQFCPVVVNLERAEDAEAGCHREREANAPITRLQAGVYRSHTGPDRSMTAWRDRVLIGRNTHSG
jgi:hypothetical protein